MEFSFWGAVSHLAGVDFSFWNGKFAFRSGAIIIGVGNCRCPIWCGALVNGVGNCRSGVGRFFLVWEIRVRVWGVSL